MNTIHRTALVMIKMAADRGDVEEIWKQVEHLPKQIPVLLVEAGDFLEIYEETQFGIEEAEMLEQRLTNIRDFLRPLLHNKGVRFDPDIAQSDGQTIEEWDAASGRR